jgi:hypothetical protein
MSKKATTQDARLILELYHLRREVQMRKARRWWMTDFWPENAVDYLKVEMARKTPESDWLRQVVSYWGMAASFVLHGTLSEKGFSRCLIFHGDVLPFRQGPAVPQGIAS